MEIRVRVVPNAKRVRMEREGDVLKVWVDAPARDGKANKRLVEIIAKAIRVKKSEIRIVRGEKSREKIIEVPDHAAKHLSDRPVP